MPPYEYYYPGTTKLKAQVIYLIHQMYYHVGKPIGIGRNCPDDSGTCYMDYYSPFHPEGVNIAFRNIISLLRFKHRLRLRVRNRIRDLYIDNQLLKDLGNIVMNYVY
jgi:hypothetical protein